MRRSWRRNKKKPVDSHGAKLAGQSLNQGEFKGTEMGNMRERKKFQKAKFRHRNSCLRLQAIKKNIRSPFMRGRDFVRGGNSGTA